MPGLVHPHLAPLGELRACRKGGSQPAPLGAAPGLAASPWPESLPPSVSQFPPCCLGLTHPQGSQPDAGADRLVTLPFCSPSRPDTCLAPDLDGELLRPGSALAGLCSPGPGGWEPDKASPLEPALALGPAPGVSAGTCPEMLQLAPELARTLPAPCPHTRCCHLSPPHARTPLCFTQGLSHILFIQAIHGRPITPPLVHTEHALAPPTVHIQHSSPTSI